MSDLDTQARNILTANDRGGYTVPSPRLYPYQWNWDSAFAAMGFATFDPSRAWRELETLFDAQWSDGMVPHIVFRVDSPDYFPGPSVWGCEVDPPSSGISQPPVATSVARWLLEADGGAEAKARAAALFPKMLAWHRWFRSARDPDGAGVIAVAHPWESGRDNSPDWDAAMAAVDPSGVPPYTRRDTSHVNPEMRPTKEDYDRYLKMVAFGREHCWDSREIYQNGPFMVGDQGMTFILARADRDLLALAEMLGRSDEKAEIDGWIAAAERGAQKLWNADASAYCALDMRTGAQTDAPTSASFLAWYAGVSQPEHEEALAAKLAGILDAVEYGVPSFDPVDPRFDSLRYWRGPCWAPVNYLIGRGLQEQGREDLAERIRLSTRALIERSGFQEYFDPHSGAGAGGEGFTWTAAVWLNWASPSAQAGR